MPAELYYVNPDAVSGGILALDSNESHHLCTVLRKSPGAIFWATDGRGRVYECELVHGGKHLNASARILRTIPRLGEIDFSLTLAVGIPKKDKFEWIIEKATEIGVTKIVPLVTSRTIMKANSINAERCGRIALAAMKQCCRSILPEIEKTVGFSKFLAQQEPHAAKFIAHEKESGTDLLTELSRQRNESSFTGATLCIGPEGGFTDEEIRQAATAGFHPVGLGPRRLRTETAAIVAASLVMASAQ